MLGQLVGRFWRWELHRRDPDVMVECASCGRSLRRRELYAADCCSKACAQNYRDLTAF